jgi:hypothetical protein
MKTQRTELVLLIILTAIITGILSPSYLTAQTAIDDFLESDEYKSFTESQIKKNRKKKAPEDLRIIESEYLSLFAKGRDGGRKLIEWLGNSSMSFRRSATKGKNSSQFITGETDFHVVGAEKRALIPLMVLLPKPKAYISQSYLIIADFAELQPPKLKIDSSQEVTGVFGTGQLYFHKGGSCSLLIPLSKGGLINMGPVTCELNEKMKDLANAIDVARLNRKVNED